MRPHLKTGSIFLAAGSLLGFRSAVSCSDPRGKPLHSVMTANRANYHVYIVEESKKRSPSIRLYLSPASKQKLSEYMQKIGKPAYSSDFVVLKSNASSADCLEYLNGDILGHRAAFRLKGLAFGDGFISVSIHFIE